MRNLLAAVALCLAGSARSAEPGRPLLDLAHGLDGFSLSITGGRIAVVKRDGVGVLRLEAGAKGDTAVAVLDLPADVDASGFRAVDCAVTNRGAAVVGFTRGRG